MDVLINNDIKTNNAEQYGRRRNIVIQGIPESIKSKDLKDKVIIVLDKVNVKVTKNGKEACHGLGDSRGTILRFVNRKHLFEALKNKKMLRLEYKSFLSQILSGCNNKIAFHFRELIRKRLIDSTWAYGGKVFIKIQDNCNKEE